MSQPAEKISEMRSALFKESRSANNRAKWLEARLSVTWWGGIIAGALASIIGYVQSPLHSHFSIDIEPWVVSLLATISGSLLLFRQKTNWRVKANAYYALRDESNALIKEIDYKLYAAPTDADVGLLLDRHQKSLWDYSTRMKDANRLIDEEGGRE